MEDNFIIFISASLTFCITASVKIAFPTIQILRLSHWLALVALVLGLLGLTGWLLDFVPFKNLLVGKAVMKGNTSLMFILISGLALAGPAKLKEWGLLRAGAAFVLAMGVLTVLQYWPGIEIGLDQLFFKATHPDSSQAPPGRMTLLAALNFTFLAGALLSFSYQKPSLAQWLCLPVVISAYAVIIGYGFEVSTFYDFGVYSSMALPTALAFLCLGASLILFLPAQGFMAVITGYKAASIMARYIYGYGLVCVPLLVGFYLYLLQKQFFSPILLSPIF